MCVVRGAASQGVILPLRGYPYRSPPEIPGGPEQALVLGITRQESGFDPLLRSPAGARGMIAREQSLHQLRQLGRGERLAARLVGLQEPRQQEPREA